jgi:hypothetical protein
MTDEQHQQWDELTEGMSAAERRQFGEYLLRVDEQRREFVSAQNYPQDFITERPTPADWSHVANINVSDQVAQTQLGSVHDVAQAAWIDTVGRMPSPQELQALQLRFHEIHASLIDGDQFKPGSAVPVQFEEIQRIYDIYEEE